MVMNMIKIDWTLRGVLSFFIDNMDTEKIFENHVPFVRAGKVTISFGKPIDMTALDRNQRRQVPALVQETVADMIAQVRMKDS